MDVVMHLTKCSDGSMVASAKIAKFISTTLNIPLIHTPEQIEQYNEDFELGGVDRFILVNSSTGFADPGMRFAAAKFSYLANQAIFAQNDYKMKPPSQCKSHNIKLFNKHNGKSSDFYGMTLWTTVPEIKTSTHVEYINWNMLTYVRTFKTCEPFTRRKANTLVYWGALRKGREERLKELLVGDFNTVISTAPQSFEKFKKHLPDASYVPQFKVLSEGLLDYKITLYTQDEASDKLYCSLANRFYEALGAGVAILIDSRCADTFKRAGLEGYEKYLVDSVLDVELLIGDAERIAYEQREKWDKNYGGLLRDRLLSLGGKTL